MIGIYKITNPNGRIYIGQSTNIEGNFIKEWNSGKEASNTLGLSQPNINSCCHEKTKTAFGYKWKFKN